MASDGTNIWPGVVLQLSRLRDLTDFQKIMGNVAHTSVDVQYHFLFLSLSLSIYSPIYLSIYHPSIWMWACVCVCGPKLQKQSAHNAVLLTNLRFWVPIRSSNPSKKCSYAIFRHVPWLTQVWNAWMAAEMDAFKSHVPQESASKVSQKYDIAMCCSLDTLGKIWHMALPVPATCK